ncbi:diguanylate cyclase [Frankia sp. CNm7]|uniref:Diguanylate cyclase n=1 Tax=Frankia nepalensis TaxID=1836974 RepID=A0A937R9W5_9ACTN|nr:diguanylate cyclase [Frankia nepalensis]MBL7498912.1 diguanylate cyclase [Frankia nepalensis]MBL7513082.1 diguanylate cyclase [Frankia nepalensis]MBL7522211.1 diguanylate cyclase [Frankia nepalensis]MBL7628116.1 diguanylate cyclase [Frankia nepalensis]
MTPVGDPSTAAGVELLHESERTRITRLLLDTGSVIRKEPLGPEAPRRLRHEVEILERLAGVEGVARLASEAPRSPGAILLADVGGDALSTRATPLDSARLVDLAWLLARAVAGMHRRGVVHRDVSPANIVVSPDGDSPCLIDFALATTVPAVQPRFAHPSQIVGTLPYLAPEQTGRTRRPVDQRADLYAVGAILYELATGAPPFGAHDPLRIIHDTLTRMPPPPAAVNPAVPAGLSRIIMHLLEKEPDGRYQSADGLVRDLSRLRREGTLACPGQQDFPDRPFTPSRLAGRDREIGELDEAFAEAMAGRCSGILLGGAPGVGKTALVGELRPIVARHDGWFVSGKFDQYRRDQEYDGVARAFRALGRLLLAEPEDRLAEVREELLRRLGPNAGLAAIAVPELATLMRISPEPGDPMSARGRAQHAAVEILRAVACPRRPVVFFVDDLQWAGRTPLGFVEQVLAGEEKIEGLLLVAAYRESDVDAAHPLAPMLARWRSEPPGPRRLRLDGLPPAGQAAMVADLLRLAPPAAGELAELIAPATGGNPYDTVELLGALRHDGVLTAGDHGWRWEPAAVRARLDQVDMTGLLAGHVATLPPATTALLAAVACLAGQVEFDLLEAATGLDGDELERRLAPAFADGVLVLELDGRPSARFSHDRARESVLSSLTAAARQDRHLRLARRLAGRPEYHAVAAEQYLVVADAVRDAGERRLMTGLFRRAAAAATVLGNFLLAERFLTAAAGHVDPADLDEAVAVHSERQSALYCLGRLDETDGEFRTVCRLAAEPARRTTAVLSQILSLTNRNHPEEAIRLGLDQLRCLGFAVPDREDLGGEIDRGLDALYPWMEQTDESDDLRRSGVSGRERRDAMRIFDRLMPAAYFCDHEMMAWLTVQALALWARHGPDPALLGPAGHIAFVTIVRRGDYRTGHRIMRRLLAVGRARGYEPELWMAWFLYVVSTGHWFDALETNVAEARDALAALLRNADLHHACWTHYVLLSNLLDSAPTLEVYLTEVDEALAMAARTGNGHAEETFLPWRRLARVLRGEAADSAADETAVLGKLTGNPFALANLHATRAITAAVLDQPAELARHTAAAMAFVSTLGANHVIGTARVLRAVAVAWQARTGRADGRDAALAELDELVDWLSERAADAPVNFQHLLRLVEAERAWAVGHFRQAACGFDLALREAATRGRPWHRALIAERAARFYLAHGMTLAGNSLLAAARRQYVAWGAAAKVGQLDWAHPTLAGSASSAPPGQSATRRSTFTAGTIDVRAIVAASQALSSETTIEGLRVRLKGILSEMTGATGVHVLLWSPEERGWLAPACPGGTDRLAEAGPRCPLPSSVIRYAERTGEPVVVADATRDDRFRRDPCFRGLDRCSLLAVPIAIRGEPRAMLVLENRMIRSAFSHEHLEGIMLIAGQLTVSLDNLQVYASLERKVAERTGQLAAANRRLEQLSVTDPLTGLANRRRLEEVLGSEWNRARQQARPLALAMIDIDHFKLYNDHFGHAAGDRCLARVAARLVWDLGNTPLAARYGGEEFVLVLPDTDVEAAGRLAWRLCRGVTELAEPHPLVAARVVTVSVGVAAAVPAAGDEVAGLVERADAALYRAKRGGRGRVEAAPG